MKRNLTILIALVILLCLASPVVASVSALEGQTAAQVWGERLDIDPTLATCQLTIPKIGMDISILEMTEDSLLDIGPGHWPETPLPGMDGGFVLSGHRTVHGGPFSRLGELVPGDSIIVELPYATISYEVTETLIVGVYDVDVVRSRGVEELYLTTCHPPGSSDYVMVIRAGMVGSGPATAEGRFGKGTM
jgi:LPXTG-site transpeptidase (sortase) family protein